ncbi:MAG: hypothetical protein JJU00_20245 [Opitutales bacterium]|nr:hypothetical protein [Opitutales bacterium]
MFDKIQNQFGVHLSPGDLEALNAIQAHNLVSEIQILPSFKRKEISLNSRHRFFRCDDIVLKASGVDAKLADYQIGCGFLLMKVGIKTIDLIYSLQDILYKSILLSDNTRPEFDFFIPNQELHFRSPENICSEASLFESVCSGWTHDYSKKRCSFNPFELTGSHYLDVLSQISNEGKDESWILLHSCGCKIPSVPARMKVKRAHSYCPDSIQFGNNIPLFRKWAAANRMGIVTRFLRPVQSILGNFETELIVDQPHHDVVGSEEEGYTYYNDSQQLVDGRPAILPSGFADSTSYLVMPGPKKEDVLCGLSHNLKPVVRRDSQRFQTENEVLIAEALLPGRLGRFLKRPPSLSFHKKPVWSSPASDRLIADLIDRQIISEATPLYPVFRFRVRRSGERALARTLCSS